MKGYAVNSGYMGYIHTEGRYMLFATEDDYVEYMEDLQRKEMMELRDAMNLALRNEFNQ